MAEFALAVAAYCFFKASTDNDSQGALYRIPPRPIQRYPGRSGSSVNRRPPAPRRSDFSTDIPWADSVNDPEPQPPTSSFEHGPESHANDVVSDSGPEGHAQELQDWVGNRGPEHHAI